MKFNYFMNLWLKETKNIIYIIIFFFIYQGCTNFEYLSQPKELRNLKVEEKIYASPLIGKEKLLQNVEQLKKEELNLYGKTEFYVEKVYIKNEPISNKNEITPKVVNFFHWTTAPKIIEQELLYLENNGKITNYELLKESERNLRSIGIFKSVTIFYFKVPNKSKKFLAKESKYKKGNRKLIPVYIGIVTKDKITNTLNFNPDMGGGNKSFVFSIGEKNLLGKRYILNGSYRFENSLNKINATAGKERIYGSNWNTAVGMGRNYYTNKWIRNENKIIIERPFYNLRVPWRFYFDIESNNGKVVKFASGEEEKIQLPDGNTINYPASYYQNEMNYKAEVSRVFGIKKRLLFTLGAGQTKKIHKSIVYVPSNLNKYFLPRNYKNIFILGGIGYETVHFFKTKNFKKYIHEEDIKLGFSSKYFITQTVPVSISQDKFSRFTEEISYSNSYSTYFLYSLKIRNQNQRENSKWLDNLTTSTISLFWGFNPLGYFANKLSFEFGSSLFAQNLLANKALDIRGLGTNRLKGNRKIIKTTEFRTTPFLISYFAIGFVFFNDWGDVWYSESSKFKLRGTVGIGLRTEIYEFQDVIFRIDIGIPVVGNPDKKINKDTIISGGMGYTF